MATLSFTSISIVTNFITSRQHPGTTLTMQLITMIVAVALLSTSALASPEKMEKRGPVSALPPPPAWSSRLTVPRKADIIYSDKQKMKAAQVPPLL